MATDQQCPSDAAAGSGRVTFRENGPTKGSAWVINLSGKPVGQIARRMAGGFYWYATEASMLINTSSHGPKTVDECKAEARAFFRQNVPTLPPA
jgi:hypothetical protein